MRLRAFQADRGMSLVEATIILMVLGVLSSVLSPAIGDYVNDAKQVKVKEDCEAIGVTIARLARDVGQCLKLNAAAGCSKTNRADILYSGGPDVNADDLDASAVGFSSPDVQGALNWDKDDSRGDSMERQFVTNAPNYPTPATTGGYLVSGPQFGLGWRGAYLSAIGSDSWGKRYLTSTAFLAVANDASGGSAEGNKRGGWSHDVICISAGTNGLFETPFGDSGRHGTARGGDDFVYVVAGDTR